MGVQVGTTPTKRGYRVYSDAKARRATTTICYCTNYEDAVRIADSFRRQKPGNKLHLFE